MPIKWIVGATVTDKFSPKIHGEKWASGCVVYRKGGGHPGSRLEIGLWKRLLKLEKK